MNTQRNIDDEYAKYPIHDPSTLYGIVSAKVTVTYCMNGKPITRVFEKSHVAGITAVIFADFLTCSLILYGFLSAIYMPLIRAYLSIVFTDMEEVASFAEVFVVAYTLATCMFTAILLHVLVPIYGLGGNPSADVLTMVESAWKKCITSA